MKKKLKLKKETLNALTRPEQVAGATGYICETGSLTCPPQPCPSAPYQSCAPPQESAGSNCIWCWDE
jgi:hypothetical protein